MPTYAVTSRATGAEVYRYASDGPVEWSGLGFADHDHFVQPDPSAPPAPAPPPRELTPIEFMRRFTAPERIAARAARKTDAALDDFYSLLEQAPLIHSDDPDVAAGLDYMTQVGLLAVGRAAEILNG